ncbi:MAG: hypothetical protein AAGI36_00925 [Pseudomonadota bacterium]
MTTEAEERADLEAEVLEMFEKASPLGQAGMTVGAALIKSDRIKLAREVMRKMSSEYPPTPDKHSQVPIALCERIGAICPHEEVISWGTLMVFVELTDNAPLVDSLVEMMERRVAC